MQYEKMDIKMLAYIKQKKTVRQDAFFRKFGNTLETNDRIDRLIGSVENERLIDCKRYKEPKSMGLYVAFEITGPGMRILRDYKEKQSELTRRYWITTGISILAIIIASMALLGQLGILPLPLLTK